MFGEGCRLRRKDFQDADQFLLVENGNDQHGTNAEAAGDGGIDAWVGFGVEAKLGLPSVETGTGDAIAGVEGNAEIGSVQSGGGAAHHFVAARESQGGGTGAGVIDGAHDQLIEDEVESEFGREAGFHLLPESAVQIGPCGKD